MRAALLFLHDVFVQSTTYVVPASVVQYAVIICLIILLQIVGAILGGVFHSKVATSAL